MAESLGGERPSLRISRIFGDSFKAYVGIFPVAFIYAFAMNAIWLGFLEAFFEDGSRGLMTLIQSLVIATVIPMAMAHMGGRRFSIGEGLRVPYRSMGLRSKITAELPKGPFKGHTHGSVFLVALAVGSAITVATLMFVLPGVYLLARLFVAAPSSSVECCGIRGSIARSWELTAAHQWKMILVGLLSVLIVILMMVVILVPVVAIDTFALNDMIYESPVGAVTVNTFMQAITIPFFGCVMAAAYVSLREISDGWSPHDLAEELAKPWSFKTVPQAPKQG